VAVDLLSQLAELVALGLEPVLGLEKALVVLGLALAQELDLARELAEEQELLGHSQKSQLPLLLP